MHSSDWLFRFYRSRIGTLSVMHALLICNCKLQLFTTQGCGYSLARTTAKFYAMLYTYNTNHILMESLRVQYDMMDYK